MQQLRGLILTPSPLKWTSVNILHTPPFGIKAIYERPLTEKNGQISWSLGCESRFEFLDLCSTTKKKSFLLAHITQGVIHKLR